MRQFSDGWRRCAGAHARTGRALLPGRALLRGRALLCGRGRAPRQGAAGGIAQKRVGPSSTTPATCAACTQR